MSEMKLAPTCSTCKKALWSKGDYYQSGKKQMGICMGLCDGLPPERPKEPYPVYVGPAEKRPSYNRVHSYVRIGKERFSTYWYGGVYRDNLYTMARKSHLVDRQVYLECVARDLESAMELTERWYLSDWEDTKLDWDKALEGKAEWQAKKEKFGWAMEVSSWIDKYPGPEALAEERLIALNRFLKNREAIEVQVVQDLSAFYDAFKANYDWWQENWPKCRTCHRVTTCDLYEEETRRETVARSVARGGHSLHKGEG